MEEMILLVDDDPNVLNAYRRTLRKTFKLKTALGSEMGLKTFMEEGPFSVVISDMKMPGMNGVEFLQKVREHNPETVRIMLTGYAEFESVIAAINKGHIFRYITKPCEPDEMAEIIKAGIEHYQLVRSEKILLDKTLKNSVKVLTDILSIINPIAFGRASRIRRYVLKLAELLQFKDVWILEMSAMLSQIGFVALPGALLDKVFQMEDLDEKEQAALNEYPKIGADLIQDIPKMEIVTEIIRRQLWDFQKHQANPAKSYDEKVMALGAQILKAIMSFDELISRGLAAETSIALMEKKTGEFNPKILNLLSQIQVVQDFTVTKKVLVEELTTEMITLEEIRSSNGLLLIPKYQEVTNLIIERLSRHKKESGVKEPIPVAFTNY